MLIKTARVNHLGKFETAWKVTLPFAAPYVLTLLIMIATSSRTRSLTGAPGELSITK